MGFADVDDELDVERATELTDTIYYKCPTRGMIEEFRQGKRGLPQGKPKKSEKSKKDEL